MVRVHVLVEGQTEETFANKVLQPCFSSAGVFLYPRLVGKPGHRGGIGEYPRARRDILTTLRQDTDAFCTTMFDYYGMPASWPNREAARQRPFAEKPVVIEQAILADIARELGSAFNAARFIPYVQMYEFEALLFSDPTLLADGLDLADDSETHRIRDQFQSPEEINDSKQTAPSKRIKALSPGYSKVMDGVLISQKIGLSKMRAACSHFNEWLTRLETLATVERIA
ncbi:MAG TPA: DUF4276 family protein [Sedimentisphaerales bacterium]|jgi:hypothetical protein|nr:DUF4276 family protein [Sedimentisphaerales bacterium]HNU27551.1 DUF4276 family protein [Sedimentisphaerales bacterium]